MLDTLDVNIDPRAYVADLSVAERQMVEIAKALSYESRLIIMDEPTATLTEKEVLQDLRDREEPCAPQGVAIIYISHRLEEAFELSDRITVMRDGRKIGTKDTRQTDKDEIVEMMVGKVVKDYFAEAAAPGRVAGGRCWRCATTPWPTHVENVELQAAQGRDPGPGRGHRLRRAPAAAVPVRGDTQEVRGGVLRGRGRWTSSSRRTPSAWASAT